MVVNDRKIERLPHLHKIGCYLFFGICAFGVGVLAFGLSMKIGFNRDAARIPADAAVLVTFMALRDMLKQKGQTDDR